MAQCPSRAVGLDCVMDTKIRPDGKCPFCGGVVGRPTDGIAHNGDPELPERGHPSPGVCYPPKGWHFAIVYELDGTRRFMCGEHLREIYHRSG